MRTDTSRNLGITGLGNSSKDSIRDRQLFICLNSYNAMGLRTSYSLQYIIQLRVKRVGILISYLR